MPRKSKKQLQSEQEQELDIVEINYDGDLNQENHEQQEPEQELEVSKPKLSRSTKPPLSEKRLEALAKGREKARLNREAKKKEEQESLKAQLKLEMQEMLSAERMQGKLEKEELRLAKTSESRKQKEPSLRQPEGSPPESPKHKVHAEQKKQKDPPAELDRRKPKKVVSRSPSPVQKKSSKAQEAQKVVSSAKKQMPIFKDEVQAKSARKNKIKDFFKPVKVVYVEESDSESN